MKHLTVGLLLTVLACAGPADSTDTPPSQAEPDRLIAELDEAGAEAEQVETFGTDPLGSEGLILCVGTEEVRVYLFGSDEERAAAAARIDRDDPSNLGNAIVEWAGNPRFWQRGPMLVLYLGHQPTEDLLTEVLGPPFARGAGPGRGLPALPGPCTDR